MWRPTRHLTHSLPQGSLTTDYRLLERIRGSSAAFLRTFPVSRGSLSASGTPHCDLWAKKQRRNPSGSGNCVRATSFVTGDFRWICGGSDTCRGLSRLTERRVNQVSSQPRDNVIRDTLSTLWSE
ncbi:hypothetical protein J6590_024684 [Homalodisca vitripennis]|nr:hypothetical protein J6590_024684 [Homalodisca vitripennis]